MNTTTTNPPSTDPTGQPSGPISHPASGPRRIHSRRRVLLSVAVAAALGFGAGAAVVGLTSSGDASSRPAHAAPAASPKVDVRAVWNDLAALPAREQANVVAGLTPSVRARLRAIAEGYAVAAEHH